MNDAESGGVEMIMVILFGLLGLFLFTLGTFGYERECKRRRQIQLIHAAASTLLEHSSITIQITAKSIINRCEEILK